MSLKISELPLVFLIAFSFAALLGLIFLGISSFRKMLHRKDTQQAILEQKSHTKDILTTGEQLNKSFKYSVYFITIEIILILMTLTFYSLNKSFSLIDIWPILLVIIVLLITCLGVIDWAFIKSKRTFQKELRKF